MLGRRIGRVEWTERRVVSGDLEAAAGFRIDDLRRWGKHIVADLSRGRSRAHLLIHLGMTGQLVLNGPQQKHTHVVFDLEGGDRLLYNDPRQFGRVQFATRLPGRLAELGPDPLEIDEKTFVGRLRARRAMVKALLLNQEFLRGLGNIYADEALFRAGVHPRAIGSRLRPERAARLYRAIRRVLREAIRAGGSSVSDYVDSEGRAGWFQFRHQVYGRTGQRCQECGVVIRRIVVGSRGTHYCVCCQRR